MSSADAYPPSDTNESLDVSTSRPPIVPLPAAAVVAAADDDEDVLIACKT